LTKIFDGANSGKLNDAQQLACMQYVAYLNDSIMQVFTNPQVTSEERPHTEVLLDSVEEHSNPTSVSEDAPQDAETAKVKEMTKDAVTIASGKEQSRAQRQEKDSGIGTGSKVKKK
jgi:hypothetical protein